ncbi:hypothetical protein [Thermomonospora cellulosilytica]|uniref:Uncharacterized protein n=1 Tax=Thermomonospora cellulosilytica TaxID=1411118 RepID=A0A7W3N1P9_9ACTN|nr:hypothetical protein [Thermomonospora cellulosilytica]MBA9005915.1 hypothetical protein [Thermomonospora cellulosilytica]
MTGGPAGLLAEIARSGPPRSYVLDNEVYALTGSWWPLTSRLIEQVTGWRLLLLLELTDPEDGEVLVERLDDPDDPLEPEDLDQVAETLVLQATGRPWWVTGRLLATALARWAELDGELIGRGVDLAQMVDRAPARACNLVYAWLIQGADRKERDKLDAKLTRPPVQELRAASPRTQQWLAEEEGAAFMAAMGAAQSSGALRLPPGQPPNRPT